MAGTFPGVSGVQQIDSSGTPLAGGRLSVFIGGTNTLALTYQDIGLAILSTNPLIADVSGRIPLFFVADGTYKVRLTDQFGDVTNGGFEYPQCPSIGASTSGGGGSAVDPTTILSTGDLKSQLSSGLLTGWVRCNGRTIGNAVSGASERASADTQALFIYLWTSFSDAICPVLGGRGASALVDYNNGKQITLHDARGRALVGLDDMGNIAAGRLNGVVFAPGSTATLGGGQGGEGTHTLIKAELSSAGQTAPDHLHAITPMQQTNITVQAGSGNNFSFYQPSGSINTALASIALSQLGNDQPHNNMPPFLLGTVYIKL